jgi:hypothetical protein
MHVTERDDEIYLMLHDKANFDKVVGYLGAKVVTTDPFGPEPLICSKCGGDVAAREVEIRYVVRPRFWKRLLGH